MQKKLSQWATENPEEQYRDLYSLLCNAVWLRVAHHSVNANQGRDTAGIDGATMSNFNGDVEGNLARLREALKAKTFEPLPVRRVYIPKAHGKKRPLGIPTIDDRIVQEALRMALEPIWEADFSIHSYGFRPNRSTYDAMTYIGKRLTGTSGLTYQWIIEGDIASYFDTIPHRRLIKAVKKRVADRNIRVLLWKFLRAGVMHQGNIEDTLTGTPQGGIVSPLLANIYLHELDQYMESTHLHLTEAQRSKRRQKGQGNYLYVRYADDFVVLCNGTKAEALGMKEELRNVLNQMGLTLSEEKTKVTHITEGFDFLGYRVRRGMGRKGKMAPKVLIPEKAIKKFRHKVREILAPHRAHESVNAKIAALNWLVRGWCEYYRCTSGPSQVFGRLSHEVYYDMAHWLGRKYKLSIPAVLKRFMRDNTFRTKTRKLIMPSEYKAKRFVAHTWHNPYIEKEKVKSEKERMKRESLFAYDQLWTGYEDRQGGMDLREEVILTKGTTCYVCGTHLHPSEVEIDHMTPRARFKEPAEADRMKHLQPICTSCHRAKTKTDLKVLSRVR
jgi:group II intron reverse transcriptase/maturase